MGTANLRPAAQPTIHFIGVSTQGSSIRRVFPVWARELGLSNAELHGIDLPLHAGREAYRSVVNFVRNDALSRGALVTTHKIDLYRACADLFDEQDWFARSMGEVSSISKRQGSLIAQAKDPVSAGRTLLRMIPPGYWTRDGSEVLCLGAGGAGVAITWFLLAGQHPLGRPTRVIVTDVDAQRLGHLRTLVDSERLLVSTVSESTDNSRLLGQLPPGSLIINATGLGKDRPGSPLDKSASFPSDSIVWELNYRGELDFLQQAKRQAVAQKLQVHDGWDYFIHGWTSVISDVFGIEIADDQQTFERLSQLAIDAAAGA
ncbi:MAG: shikimate dehydrogenase [Verrucomicrobia bacterium]|nr:shikimate dehydrogenase [Verrucomicrobiota bacterium]